MRAEHTWTARLSAETPLTPSVRHLTFEVEAPENFEWLPGQHLELSSKDAPAERFPYSLASAQDPAARGRFELAVRRDGSARAVERLRADDTILVGAPRGSFVRVGDNPRSAVFIAMGTGLAPIRAMIQSALAHETRAELALLFGCRSEADILWARELAELNADGRLSFMPTLSQPTIGWTGRRGYIHAHLGELRDQLARSEVFVCGSRAMVDELGPRLQELGVTPERLWLEGY